MVIQARAPASTSNLGPGFDTLGAALSIGLTVTLVDGTPLLEPGLVERAIGLASGRPLEGLVQVDTDIPIARGLGSSGACIAAGLLIGCALASREPDPHELLRLGLPLEGHPDNLAAALFGGFTVALPSGDVLRLEPSASVRPFILVPHERLSTAEARGVLPESVPRGDAVSNVANTAGLVAMLTGVAKPTRERLLSCTEDRIHQPYRAPLMQRTADAVAALRAEGVAAAVSGAGPSVLCLVITGDEDSVRGAAGTLNGWELMELDWNARGAYIEEGE